MKENSFKNVFPKISSSVIGKEINRDEMNKLIESQEKDPNSYISRSNELKRRRSEKSEEELREIRSAENLEKIANSNDEILLNSRKIYEFLKIMQNELNIQSEKSDEFNENIKNLALQLKDINEGPNKSENIFLFFKKISGEIAIAVFIYYIENLIK